MGTKAIFNSKEELLDFVYHAFATCTTLSSSALAWLSRIVKSKGGYPIPKEYITKHIVPELIERKIIYESSPKVYTVYGKKESKDMHELDAFWVFLQHIDGVVPQSFMRGPRPASITYVKNNRIYHIVRCNGDGIAELGMAVQLEIEMNQHKRTNVEGSVEERFIFIFDEEIYARNAPLKLNSLTLFAVVDYDGAEKRSKKPKINYLRA